MQKLFQGLPGIILYHALNNGWLIYAGRNERDFNQHEFFSSH